MTLTGTGGCPADPALGTSKSTNFAGGASSDFTAAKSVNYGSNGAEFTVARQGDNPQLTSNFYIMFGHVEWVLKAAPGTGIVSSAVLQSDCLDEIDWEWLGGDDSQVQSNTFGKGIASGQGGFHAASNNHDQFHTYTLDWTADQIVWQVDGVTVRALTASSSGSTYPQTPMHVKMGIWAGGDPSNPPGTIAWAGGQTDYSAGPYTMYVKSVKVTDYSTGSQYTYGDTSGTWGSIRSQGGKINSNGNGTPASSGDAPAVTSAVSGTAPLAFDPSESASAYATRTGWPWSMDSATATLVTAVSGGYTSIAGLPSGWTVSDSGKVIPPSVGATSLCSVLPCTVNPSMLTVLQTPSPSISSPSASLPASPLASGLSVRTTYDNQGFTTTITYDPATATLPVSWDSQGFPITPSAAATTPAPAPASSPVSIASSVASPSAELVPSSVISSSSLPAAASVPISGSTTGVTSAVSTVAPSGVSSGPSSALSTRPSTSASDVVSVSTQTSLATSTRHTTVTNREPSQASATNTTQETPAAPANGAPRKEVGLGLGVVLAVLLLV